MVKKLKWISNAQKIRDYVAKHVGVKPKDIAAALKLNTQYVYQVLHKMKPKKIFVTTTEAKIARRLGVKIEDYAEQRGLLFKQRMQDKWQPPAMIPMPEPTTDNVNHPAHYKAGGIETIDFIEAKELGYHLGNVVKYVTRADHKGNKLEDLKKAQWYLTRAIEKL